jgi:hypothetical protein
MFGPGAPAAAAANNARMGAGMFGLGGAPMAASPRLWMHPSS